MVSWDMGYLADGAKTWVMIAPTCKGQSGFETQKAERLAALGYVGFAINIYGQGKTGSYIRRDGALMAVLNNGRALLLRHMQLATKPLRQLP